MHGHVGTHTQYLCHDICLNIFSIEGAVFNGEGVRKWAWLAIQKKQWPKWQFYEGMELTEINKGFYRVLCRHSFLKQGKFTDGSRNQQTALYLMRQPYIQFRGLLFYLPKELLILYMHFQCYTTKQVTWDSLLKNIWTQKTKKIYIAASQNLR